MRGGGHRPVERRVQTADCVQSDDTERGLMMITRTALPVTLLMTRLALIGSMARRRLAACAAAVIVLTPAAALAIWFAKEVDPSGVGAELVSAL
jgi:hypothetical protein